MASWIATAVLFVLFSRTPMEWFATEEQATVSINSSDATSGLLNQVFFAAMIGCSLLITAARRVNWQAVVKQNKALVLFYIYFLLSSAWSRTPSDSLIRIVKDFGCTVAVIALILSERKPLEALRAVYVRCACILIPLSAVLIRFSSLGKIYTKDGFVVYGGATQNKNEFGEMLFVLIMFLLWDYLESTRGKKLRKGFTLDRVFLIVTGLWLLNLSQSKTSMVTMVIGSVLLLRKGWLDSPMMSRVTFAATALYPLLALTGQTVFAPVLEMLGRDMTFTGRANIWEHITLSTVNPIIGAGFWNFWGGPGGHAIETAMDTGIPNAHDGYLDIYLDGGFIGVGILWFVLLTRGAALVKRIPENRFGRLQFALLVVGIVHNVTESSFGRLSGMWFTIVLALIDFPGLKDTTTNEPDKVEQSLSPERHLLSTAG